MYVRLPLECVGNKYFVNFEDFLLLGCDATSLAILKSSQCVFEDAIVQGCGTVSLGNQSIALLRNIIPSYASIRRTYRCGNISVNKGMTTATL
jgi:hypothetical protein